MTRNLLCVAAVLVTLTAALLAQAPAKHYGGPIIDVHMHCYTQQEWQDNKMPNPITKRPLTAKNAEDHRTETLAQMRRFNVVKGIVSGEGYKVALDWRRKDRDRFLIGFGIDDPKKFN